MKVMKSNCVVDRWYCRKNPTKCCWQTMVNNMDYGWYVLVWLHIIVIHHSSLSLLLSLSTSTIGHHHYQHHRQRRRNESIEREMKRNDKWWKRKKVWKDIRDLQWREKHSFLSFYFNFVFFVFILSIPFKIEKVCVWIYCGLFEWMRNCPFVLCRFFFMSFFVYFSVSFLRCF